MFKLPSLLVLTTSRLVYMSPCQPPFPRRHMACCSNSIPRPGKLRAQGRAPPPPLEDEGSQGSLQFVPQHTDFLSSHVGIKSIHRCLRTHSADLFEKYLQKQQAQLGGNRKMPVTLGVQQARVFLRSRKAAGLCVGTIFLDLCEAFYRIVRELAIGGPVCDEMIVEMGRRLRMGPDLLHTLYTFRTGST